ncbi:hypothetical protein [Nocardioides iriomotensis]|uniref:Uncharacterized protein n=1 Tax=Nocardioides iriomotensis TaxID=715784 RepID=A0A4Q5J721_9ACTN|nr:hypothetical protein [Nocardioides iriomotensis]RYU13425.1 hypothetical protein ETU37_06220 [Nocardioides iriomotensis]
MSRSSELVLLAAGSAASAGSTTDRPAGAAPLDQVLIATGSAAILCLALGALVLAHRRGQLTVLGTATDWLERQRWTGDLAGWAILPLLTAMLSLVTALLGMYWDIALHIAFGRDAGPLANPAHYPIMFGLYGISASGVLACALPRGDEAGPAGVQLTRSWRAPVGGVLLACAGSYALLGFPLDDIWHRIFGQDVTLWGPTHLMLIGGAGLSLVAMAILFQEGRHALAPVAGNPRPVHRYVLQAFLAGGMLIGLSVFQAEFDFGVPQFRLVLQPLLIASAAALSLVFARLWIGRGGALAAVGFYLLVRGGVSVVVGPGLGELWATVPLYVAEAVLVELAAVQLAHRPLTLGAVAGGLIGTVGFAAEYAWTQVAFPLPWTTDVLSEGLPMALAGGLAGGLLGGLLVRGLRHDLPARRTTLALFAGSLAAIAATTTNGVVESVPDDLTATLSVTDRAGSGVDEEARVEVRFDQPPVQGTPAWLTVTAWQGGASRDLRVVDLERVDATTYRTPERVPVGGSWKTLVRVQDGRDISGVAVYMPADRVLDEPEVTAKAATRPAVDEKLILQRELNDDVPGWLWGAAGLVVLVCSLALAIGLGWGVRRFSESTASGTTADDREEVPA